MKTSDFQMFMTFLRASGSLSRTATGKYRNVNPESVATWDKKGIPVKRGDFVWKPLRTAPARFACIAQRATRLHGQFARFSIESEAASGAQPSIHPTRLHA